MEKQVVPSVVPLRQTVPAYLKAVSGSCLQTKTAALTAKFFLWFASKRIYALTDCLRFTHPAESLRVFNIQYFRRFVTQYFITLCSRFAGCLKTVADSKGYRADLLLRCTQSQDCPQHLKANAGSYPNKILLHCAPQGGL